MDVMMSRSRLKFFIILTLFYAYIIYVIIQSQLFSAIKNIDSYHVVYLVMYLIIISIMITLILRCRIKIEKTWKSLHLYPIIVIALMIVLVLYIAAYVKNAALILYIIYYNLWYVLVRELPSLSLIALLLPCILLAMILYYVKSYVKRLSVLLLVAVFFLIILNLVELFVLVECFYPRVIEGFRSRYGSECTLESAWNLAIEYFSDFRVTYREPLPKPRQFGIVFGNKYLWAPRKLVVIVRMGSCEDIALGVTTLVKDVLGCEAWVVGFIGVDHALPEVKVNDAWYVFDISYTTPVGKGPVKVSDYLRYLQNFNQTLSSQIRGLINYETGENVSIEHGLIVKSQ